MPLINLDRQLMNVPPVHRLCPMPSPGKQGEGMKITALLGYFGISNNYLSTQGWRTRYPWF